MTITPKGLAKIIRPFYKPHPKHPNWGKLDFVCVISGPRGFGKSTILLRLMQQLAPRTKYENNLVYSKSALLAKISKEQNQVIGVDEAINVVFKREFYEHNQIGILQDLDTYRSNHHCIFFLIPDFWDLDSKLLNSSLIKIWIRINKWGEAYIMKPTNKMFARDPWNFDLNNRLEQKGIIHTSPNYVDTMVWREMPKEDYAKYDAVKIVKREEARQERTKQYDISAKQKTLMQRRLSLIKLCLKYGIKNAEVAEASGMSQPAISRIIHSNKGLADNITEESDI